MISRKKEISNEAITDGTEFQIRLSVKIGNKLIESDLDEELAIPTVDKLNPTIISNMMTKIPSLHARWNYLYNEAAYEYDMLKTKIDVWEAKKSMEYRRILNSQKEGRVTDKAVDEMIKADPEYKELNDALALAKKNMKNILTQAFGFGEKGERLVNISAMMKWESATLGGMKSGKTGETKEYKSIRNADDFSDKADPKVNGGWPAE